MSGRRSAPKGLQRLLDEVVARAREQDDWGAVASYIPELAGVDPRQFGISVCTLDGRQWSAGDADRFFSIQSVSKAFTLALALGRHGDRLWRRVCQEPSGNPFNSIIQLELEDGRPRNPFVNAGAIVVTDALLDARAPREMLAELLRFLRAEAADENIFINDAVARSEAEHGDRNASIAHFLRACGNLRNDVDAVLGAYFHQCAVEMTCAQLARAGRFLLEPGRAGRLIAARHLRCINALMLTCGHYDGSGAFACRVGVPAKSGVGGGILAVVPGKASVAVWSPGLDRYGNSRQGTLALEHLSKALDWSVAV